ncbi:MAG TPA: HDOD domain-containing protein [Bacteroidota bacterium]|nr:HDOD domain-containing protein [Bacteroidota bacterium]
MLTSPRDLLRGYVEISSLPKIHARLEEAINNPRKSMSDIARIIREDAGLSARLLRIVNSVFYSFPSKVETITHAVTIVGTQQLGALALATSVIDLFKGIPREFVTMDSFWRHSVGCGLAARTLATFRREQNVERFFVAGMMHDIGRLVIFTKAPDMSRETILRCTQEKLMLYDAEREVVGYTHAVIGSSLMEMWKLPISLEEVVRCHHNPETAVHYPVEAAIIHLADIIAHVMQLGSSGEHYVPPLNRAAWNLLGFPEGILSATMTSVEHQYDDAIESLGVSKIS